MENTNLIVLDENEKMIADLTAERHTSYCSMKPETEDDEIILYNAMNNPEKRVGDCINMKIKIKDVFCEIVQCTNQETGEITQQPRTVLIDDKGVGYQCVSTGVFSSLKKLFAIKGTPNTWEKPVTVTVKQVKHGINSLLTLELSK